MGRGAAERVKVEGLDTSGEARCGFVILHYWWERNIAFTGENMVSVGIGKGRREVDVLC